MSSRIFTVPPRIRLLSIQFASGDSLNANSGAQTFATAFTVTPDVWVKDSIIRVSWVLSITSSAATVTGHQYTLNAQKAGPTNVVLQASVTAGASTAPSASLSAKSAVLQAYIYVTAAPTNATAMDSSLAWHQFPIGGTAAASGLNGQTAQTVNLDLTVNQALQLIWTSSNSTAGNSVALRQMIVEQIGP